MDYSLPENNYFYKIFFTRSNKYIIQDYRVVQHSIKAFHASSVVLDNDTATP